MTFPKILKDDESKKKNDESNDIDIDQVLLESRQLMLYGPIDDKVTKQVNSELLALAQLDTKPIALWINSPGGSAQHSFAIIDTMRGLTCQVYTFICGSAFSGAGLISVAGHKRVITANSTWMMHDMWGSREDYFAKLESQHSYQKELHRRLFDHLRRFTRLSESEIEKCVSRDLWLWPKQCKKKGIVDVVAEV